MALRFLLYILVFLSDPCSLAQALSNAAIQAAIERGQSSTNKALWQQITKRREVCITHRVGMGHPVELRVIILTDADRIELEAAEAQRQLKEFSVDDAKKLLGVTKVRLEARSYNLDAYRLHDWTEQGRVHMVLKVGGKIIQPVRKEDVGYSAGGFMITSAITWFTFPELPRGLAAVTVTVIPGAGESKEKEIAVQ
jgi:hypothetical protein